MTIITLLTSMKFKPMKIQLLLTGDELMSGHIVDSNSAMVAQLLSDEGYPISRKVTVGDDLSGLIEELDQLSSNSDVLIVNGGLGPTIDDLTAQALAMLIGKPLAQNPTALQHLQAWCKQRKSTLNEANLKQTILPQGVGIIPNPCGSAVGFSIQYKQCLIICTPGVPSELRAMIEQTIIGLLVTKFPITAVPKMLRFQTFGLGESKLQQLISKEIPNWPPQVQLGFRAGGILLEVKLIIDSKEYIDAHLKCYQQLQRLIGDYIIGSDEVNLSEAVINLLNNKNQQLTVAESCTGGLIASSITEIAGASAVFEAGFVTYSNAMKHKILGVNENTLDQHGAVSKEVVTEMATQALTISSADYVIAVSGIAGPSGGCKIKPVGTVWIAWGSSSEIKTQHLVVKGNRQRFQHRVAAIALDLIRRELLDIENSPSYFS
jgi:nicotinamide-nucleotide amidase